jgi:hypothetical protein
MKTQHTPSHETISEELESLSATTLEDGDNLTLARLANEVNGLGWVHDTLVDALEGMMQVYCGTSKDATDKAYQARKALALAKGGK